MSVTGTQPAQSVPRNPDSSTLSSAVRVPTVTTRLFTFASHCLRAVRKESSHVTCKTEVFITGFFPDSPHVIMNVPQLDLKRELYVRPNFSPNVCNVEVR